MSYCAIYSIVLVCAVVLGAYRQTSVNPKLAENPIDAIYVKKFVVPGYPPLARQARVQGDVSVTVHIRSDGTVDSVSEITGPPLLVDHVVVALKSWEFVRLQNQATRLRITVRYTLAGKEAERNIVHEVSGVLPGFIQVVTNPTEKYGHLSQY